MPDNQTITGTDSTSTTERVGGRVDRLVRRSDDLPAKFTAAERRAYDWLYDAGISPWLVDLKDKTVRSPSGRHASLVAYAEFKAMSD